MELAILVVVAICVWIGMALLHALTDDLDGCSCFGLLLVGFLLLLVIGFAMSVGWS